MSDPQQMANNLQGALNSLYKQRTREVPGLLGDGTTEERVIVDGATQRVWFRPDPYPNALWQPIHLNSSVPLYHGMAAIIEFNETDGEWYVQQIDRKKYAEQESLDLRYQSDHSSQHIINEDSIPSDPVWVYRRAMAMLRPSPPADGSFRVHIQSGDLPFASNGYWSGGYTADLTSYLPSAGNQKWLTISLTSALAIDINAGSEFAEGLSSTNAPPDADAGDVPICHLLLSDDTSTVVEADIWDARRTIGAFADPVLFANPTAEVGLTAVNGTATTAMRSDAAPALDQGIAPTWTGKHIHQNDIEMSGTGNDIDLNGQKLIVDADGDTWLAEGVADDIVYWYIGNVLTGSWWGSGLTLAAGKDVYPDDNTAGVQQRLDGYTSWDDHFNGTSLDVSWSWAGAPFVTPGSVTVANSIVAVVFTAGAVARGFLYKSGAPSGSYITRAWVAMNSLTVGDYLGLRWDDGSDNNYVEFVPNITTATPGVWTFQVRYRTGGGAVNVVSASTTSLPDIFSLFMQAGGTQWSNWSISAVLYGSLAMSGGSGFWQTSGNPSGLTWTPTRHGLVFNHNSTGTWQSYSVDTWQVT